MQGIIGASHRDLECALAHDKGDLHRSLINLEAKGLIRLTRTASGRAEALESTPDGRNEVVNKVILRGWHEHKVVNKETLLSGYPREQGTSVASHFLRYRAYFLRQQPRGSALPHPSLAGSLYRAYPWDLSAPDGRRDRRLAGCRAELWGWVTDVEPLDTQLPILDLAEENGGGLLVCHQVVIRRPPLQVYAIATWSPTDVGDMQVDWKVPSLCALPDRSTVEQAVGWPYAALNLLRLGRRTDRDNAGNRWELPWELADDPSQSSDEGWTRWRLARKTRQAMVTRLRDHQHFIQEDIAEALHLSLSRFTELLSSYGWSYRRLRGEARFLATSTRLGLAEAIRQAMVTRFRDQQPVTREVIAEAFGFKPSSFIPLLSTYGLSYRRLLREVEALATPPHQTSSQIH
jgi:hypothetical protein